VPGRPSVRAEHSPVGTSFVRGSRRIPQYRLPLHTSSHRTSNRALAHPPPILPHNTRTHPARFLLSISTHPRLPVHVMHVFPLFIVAISVRCTVVPRLCLKFGLVGGGGGICSSYDVGPGSGPTLLPVPRIRHARTRFGVVVFAMYFDHVA